jgi:carboxyl-terminal processing protease
MYESKQRLLSGVLLAVLIISSFFVGFFVGSDELQGGSSPTTNQEEAEANISFSPYWKTWQVLNEKHINAEEVDSKERLWSSIEGLAASFNDPYTVFFPPKESKEFQEEISGNFEGVGMEVGMKEEKITVVAPLKGTPAEKAGVQPGDLILAIDETPTFGMTIDEAVKLIRGERGTAVTLTVLRGDEQNSREISIVRDRIQIPTLETENRRDGVFVISLYNFSANVQNDFKRALSEFAISGSEKLIVDVRGNPGGYLDASVEIASYFLPSGKVVVREVGNKGEELNIFRSKGYDILTGTDTEVVVLINQGSASASEILAGALSENGVATLVGETTFGKGSVQEVVQITPDTTLKVTIAEWLTPNGTSISEGGLDPDVLVEYEPSETDLEYDNQLERAVEILLNN